MSSWILYSVVYCFNSFYRFVIFHLHSESLVSVKAEDKSLLKVIDLFRRPALGLLLPVTHEDVFGHGGYLKNVSFRTKSHVSLCPKF